MGLVICIMLTLLLVYILGRNIGFWDWALYWAACIFSMTSVTGYILSLQGWQLKLGESVTVILALFDKGILATAIFIVVMFGAVLPKKWGIRKKIMRTRGELSIVAGITLLPHLVHYLIDFMANMERFRNLTGTAFWLYSRIILFGLYAGAIFIPLWVTSFHRIRKMLKGKRWKALQRHAYLFYAFVYAHVVLVYASHDWEGYGIEAVAYTVLFATYLVLRFYRPVKSVVFAVVRMVREGRVVS